MPYTAWLQRPSTDMMKDRPNILLLFSDQHRADVMSGVGHPDVVTPNLDRLASEGTCFRHAYCQDAVCTPSRTSMMCGLYPRTLGCMTNDDRHGMMRQVVPMAEALRSSGYHTAAFGKRHLPEAPARCDDGWVEHAGHLVEETPDDNYLTWLSDGERAAFDRDWQAEWGPDPAPLASRVTELPPDKTMEAFTAERTIDLLQRSAGMDQPFFCWSSFYRPHQPYTPLPEYFDRFDRGHWGAGRRAGDGLCKPEGLGEPMDHLPPGVLRHIAGSPTWDIQAARQDEQLYRDYLASYYACLEEVDHHIGRILQSLTDTGLDDNTVVIYCSDHGEFVGAHGMPEKAASGHNAYLQTLRVPLIIRLPGQASRGLVREDLVELVDLYPTLLELTGAAAPEQPHPQPGVSLVEAASGGLALDRAYCVSENWAQATVITRTRTLSVWQDPEGRQFDQRGLCPDMLFDLEADPHQRTNRIEDAAYADDRERLQGWLDQWRGAHSPAAALRG